MSRKLTHSTTTQADGIEMITEAMKLHISHPGSRLPLPANPLSLSLSLPLSFPLSFSGDENETYPDSLVSA